MIKQPTSPYRRPPEKTPEPGQYDKHLIPFGADTKRFTIGQKQPDVYDRNPGVGQYNPDLSMTKSRISSAVIRENTNKFPKPVEQTPSPGQYDAHLTPFGSNLKNKMTIAPPYQFKPDSNPGVGSYDIESGDRYLRHRSPEVKIKKPLIE